MPSFGQCIPDLNISQLRKVIALAKFVNEHKMCYERNRLAVSLVFHPSD